MSAIHYWVIGIGLVGGYWLVSKVIQKFQKPTPAGQEHEQDPHDTTTNSASSSQPSWYEVLKVPETATLEDIRSAYKILIAQYHPDKVATLGDEIKILAERKAKEINNAYALASRLKR